MNEISKIHYVTREKLVESVSALKNYLLEQKKVDEKEKKKKSLFGNDLDSIFLVLNIEFKKTPLNKSIYIHTIRLPYHWRNQVEYEICLFVQNVDKGKGHTDRDLDLQETSEHISNLLTSKGVDSKIFSQIMPLRELYTEYKIPVAKNKLASSFDIFFVERKIMRTKFGYFSRFLGKSFWNDRNIPIPIDLDNDNLAEDLENKLDEIGLYVTGRGSSVTSTFGIFKQNDEHLADNLISILEKVNASYGENIRSLSLSTDNSTLAIPFYLDCDPSKNISIEISKNRPKPITDEFSHVDGQVTVFPDGGVRIKTNKRKQNKKENGTRPEKLKKRKHHSNKPKNFAFSKMLKVVRKKGNKH